MKVLKFGGSSVANAENIQNLMEDFAQNAIIKKIHKAKIKRALITSMTPRTMKLLV